MSADPAATVRAFFETMWNAHDLGAMDRFVSPEIRYHPARGAEGGYPEYRAMVTAFIGGFPDLRFDIEDILADARGVVATRIRITGTHRGAWHGLGATGRRIDVQGRPWLRVADGKVVEVWALLDELGALQQLGAR